MPRGAKGSESSAWHRYRVLRSLQAVPCDPAGDLTTEFPALTSRTVLRWSRHRVLVVATAPPHPTRRSLDSYPGSGGMPAGEHSGICGVVSAPSWVQATYIVVATLRVRCDDRFATSRRRGSVGLPAGVDRWPAGGPPVSLWVGGLPDLDDVTVGISDVETDFVLMLLRRRQELRARALPLAYMAWTSATRISRKLLSRSGSLVIDTKWSSLQGRP